VVDESDRSDEHRAGEDNLPGAGERHAHHPSNLDAMGQDKRRQVVGKQYGATVRKQLTVYGIFLAVVAVVVIAFLTVVSSIDNAEVALEDTAPWTEPTAAQAAPRPTDFPCNGPLNTIPRDEIGKAVPAGESDPDVDSC
jgi:hypothetical protein